LIKEKKMDLKNLGKIKTKEQYDAVCIRVDELIHEASERGLLESEYNNEYTREIGRLSRLGAIYEDEYMTFEHIKVRKKYPSTRRTDEVDANLLLEYA
jgi:hypothetical protein